MPHLIIAMQLGRYIKWIVKKIKKIKAARKKMEEENKKKAARSESKPPNQSSTDNTAWTCPALEVLTTEQKPIEIAARRPNLATPHTNTPVVDRPLSDFKTTPEYRLKTYRNVYLRLTHLGEHCGYDMVVDMLTILKKRQDEGYDIRFNIVDYDYDLRLGTRSNPLGRRVSLRYGTEWQ